MGVKGTIHTEYTANVRPAEEAAARATQATQKVVAANDDLEKKARRTAEGMEKVRGSFAAAGLAASGLEGRTAQAAQLLLQLALAGGPTIIAITGITIAISKLVGALREKEEALRAAQGARALFGVDEADIERIKAEFEDLSDKQATALATVAKEAGLTAEEIAALAARARLLADTGEEAAAAFQRLVGELGRTGDSAQRTAEALIAERERLLAQIDEEIRLSEHLKRSAHEAREAWFRYGTGTAEAHHNAAFAASKAADKAEELKRRLLDVEKALQAAELQAHEENAKRREEQRREEEIKAQQQAIKLRQIREKERETEERQAIADKRRLEDILASLDETGIQQEILAARRLQAELSRLEQEHPEMAEEAASARVAVEERMGDRIAEIRRKRHEEEVKRQEDELRKAEEVADKRRQLEDEAAAISAELDESGQERIILERNRTFRRIEELERRGVLSHTRAEQLRVSATVRAEKAATKAAEDEAAARAAHQVQFVQVGMQAAQEFAAVFGLAEEQKTAAALKAMAKQYAQRAAFLAIEGAALMFIPGMQATATGLLVQAGLMAALAGTTLAMSADAPSDEEAQKEAIKRRIRDSERTAELEREAKRELGITEDVEIERQLRERARRKEKEDEIARRLGLLDEDGPSSSGGDGGGGGATINFNFPRAPFMTASEMGKEIDRALQAYKYLRGF